MDGAGTEALVAALEACAEALERQEWRAGGVHEGGSLPRMRPPSLGAPMGGSAAGRLRPPSWPAPGLEDDAMGREAVELAAEFRDVIREVRRGGPARGWIRSLLGRASRFLDAQTVAHVEMTARGTA